MDTEDPSSPVNSKSGSLTKTEKILIGTIQGVQDQNLPKEMAITLKGSISDLTFVKSKFVSSKNNFFGKF